MNSKTHIHLALRLSCRLKVYQPTVVENLQIIEFVISDQDLLQLVMPFGKSGINEFAHNRFHILDALKSIEAMQILKITIPEIYFIANHRFKRFFALGNILDEMKVTEIYQFAIFKANVGDVTKQSKTSGVINQDKDSDVMNPSKEQRADIIINRPFFFRVIDPTTHLIKLAGFCVCPHLK